MMMMAPQCEASNKQTKERREFKRQTKIKKDMDRCTKRNRQRHACREMIKWFQRQRRVADYTQIHTKQASIKANKHRDFFTRIGSVQVISQVMYLGSVQVISQVMYLGSVQVISQDMYLGSVQVISQDMYLGRKLRLYKNKSRKQVNKGNM